MKLGLCSGVSQGFVLDCKIGSSVGGLSTMQFIQARLSHRIGGSENGGLKSIKMRIEVKHIPSRLNVRRVVFMHLEINPACPACCD